MLSKNNLTTAGKSIQCIWERQGFTEGRIETVTFFVQHLVVEISGMIDVLVFHVGDAAEGLGGDVTDTNCIPNFKEAIFCCYEESSFGLGVIHRAGAWLRTNNR